LLLIIVQDIIPAAEYDLITTSDTLYHTSSYSRLLKLIAHALKPDGVAYHA
jgi:2-polyprenyl-3-methyl-5-hydroxy-6-metoxy-1,4-benzoquinol methylase